MPVAPGSLSFSEGFMPRRPTWKTPRIFELYPGLLKIAPQTRVEGKLTYLRWTNVGDGPPEVAVVFATVGPCTWDYTIRDASLGFMRHHNGPYGDPDRDPWTDIGLEP